MKTAETRLPYFEKKEHSQSSRLISLYMQNKTQYKKSTEIYKEIIVYLENQK
ncbi:hypothetical protein ACQKCU_24435 [Heyndrickxia sporothermodurans]